MLVEVVGMLYAQNKEHLQIKYMGIVRGKANMRLDCSQLQDLKALHGRTKFNILTF